MGQHHQTITPWGRAWRDGLPACVRQQRGPVCRVDVSGCQSPGAPPGLRDLIKQAILSERGRCREAVGDSGSVPSSPTNLSCFDESVNLSAMVTILCTYFKMVKLKIIWYSFQIPFLSICFKLVTHGQDKCHQVRFSPLIYFFILVVCNWLVLKRRPIEEKIKDSRIQLRPKHIFLFAFI